MTSPLFRRFFIYSERDSLGFIIHRADIVLKNIFHSKIKKFNITREQWGIISFIYDNDTMNQKCLANIYDRDPAALAKTLDRMERNGLVIRRKDVNDKRAYLINLTKKGRELRDKIEPLASQSLKEAFSGFSDSEVESLKNLLLKITK